MHITNYSNYLNQFNQFNSALRKRFPGIPCLIIVAIFFGYMGHVMGLSNMLNTIMHTAHQLLLNTVFYLMGICVLTGALGRVFSEFGVTDLLQKLLRPIIRPLYHLPGVAILGGIMTFLSDNPAIISLTRNRKFASYFKVHEFISLTNFGTAFGMGMLVIVFMIGQGYFGAPFVGLFGAAMGGVIATRLMQRLILKEHPEYAQINALDHFDIPGEETSDKEETEATTNQSTFTRALNAILDGGKSGVDIGLAIIPGVLIICTLVMMLTFGGTVEGVDQNGKEIIVYTGGAFQGTQLLPWLAGKISFVFEWLFGFHNPELVAFPITSLGAVGAALSLIPEFTSKNIMDGNAVAVFTAMGMCWSGFLSSHTAMYDSLGCRSLLTKDFLSQIVGGISAGIIAHWTYVAIIALGTLFAPTPVWQTPAHALLVNQPINAQVQVTFLDDSTYQVKDWFGTGYKQDKKTADLCFTVNPVDSTITVTNGYAQKKGYTFVTINPAAKTGDPAYAAVYPGEQFSEFSNSKLGGYMYLFAYIYDKEKRIIDRGYYEIVWGKTHPQTTSAEAIILKNFEHEQDSLNQARAK